MGGREREGGRGGGGREREKKKERKEGERGRERGTEGEKTGWGAVLPGVSSYKDSNSVESGSYYHGPI